MNWSAVIFLSISVISMATCTALVEWGTTNYYDVQIECVKQTQDKHCNK